MLATIQRLYLRMQMRSTAEKIAMCEEALREIPIELDALYQQSHSLRERYFWLDRKLSKMM